jgi:hypothetical protein
MPDTTKIGGIEGSFSMTGWSAHIASWAADSNLDLHDVTGFASGGYREFIGGLKWLAGTAAGFLQSDGAGGATYDPKLGFTETGATTGIAGILGIRGGCKITGNFLLSRKTVATDVNGACVFSCAFRSTGVFTAAWGS